MMNRRASRMLFLFTALAHAACNFDPFSEVTIIGNPDGYCMVPDAAQADDSTHPDQIVGSGTHESCTAGALQAALSQGGVITFDCGNEPTIIPINETIVIFGSRKSKTVIDGGNKIALSGGGRRRILFMNACDPSGGMNPLNCLPQNQQSITVQNLILFDGDSTTQDSWGGGGMLVNGGRLKIVHSLFVRNRADAGDWLAGGGALRVINQYEMNPIYIVNSTFGGNDHVANIGINGGAISGIRAKYEIYNSDISNNMANGPNGLSAGGGIDINQSQSLYLCGVKMVGNRSNGAGAAIWFDGLDQNSILKIKNSSIRNNRGNGENDGYPGVKFYGSISVEASSIE